jgi:hypothetical protein
MTDFAATQATFTKTRTGGPKDRKELVEHILGWTLTILVAMLVTQLHLM